MRLLIAEDEPAMRTALTDLLEAEGYRTIAANDGAQALNRALREKPDLILLDVMMPKVDGFSVCKALRKAGANAPILMLTARGQITDRVAGLDAGADDYLPKPFSSAELLARVRALLRRRQRNEPVEKVAIGSATIDFTRMEAARGRRKLHLTPKEFAMLRLLAEARGAVVTREDFLDAAWGYGAFPTTRTVDNHIAKLRAKLETDAAHPQFIHTVPGKGYRLSAE
ncbi:MAG: response regulator transcription factor [Verrucomicrobiales bacterium]